MKERNQPMPKILSVRGPLDEKEERWVRKMAASRHGPADWIVHAQIVMRSWDGERVETIAEALGCSDQTVCRRLHRFACEGIEGLGDRPRSGRPHRLTMEDDRRIIALARSAPPGKLERYSDRSLDVREEEGEAQWSLNALVRVAKEAGIMVKRSHIRRICLREGLRLPSNTQLGRPFRQRRAPQKASGRQLLHRAARELDDHLCR